MVSSLSVNLVSESIALKDRQSNCTVFKHQTGIMETNMHTQTYTHTHIYIYICVCVCADMSIYNESVNEVVILTHSYTRDKINSS